jgi:septal ring factor EnvC (AmiA/AmiB activator)
MGSNVSMGSNVFFRKTFKKIAFAFSIMGCVFLLCGSGDSEKQRRQQLEAEIYRAEAEKQRLQTEKQQLELEMYRAETERQQLEAERQRLETEKQKVEAEKQKVEAEKQKAKTTAIILGIILIPVFIAGIALGSKAVRKNAENRAKRRDAEGIIVRKLN